MHVFSNLGKFHDSCIFDTMWVESKNLETGFGSSHTKFWFHFLNKLGNLTDFNSRLKFFLILNRKFCNFKCPHNFASHCSIQKCGDQQSAVSSKKSRKLCNNVNQGNQKFLKKKNIHICIWVEWVKGKPAKCVTFQGKYY